MKGIMVMGTASDVGKTMICTALCRILSDEGLKVAPFKSQNMSGFSIALNDGKVMSRAQYLQAEAARTKPLIEMNPILLKPTKNMKSEVFLLGERFGEIGGMDYRKRYFETALQTVEAALAKIESEFEMIVIEGAGSPAEVNLNDREIVNMRIADMADVPVLLVADIERGGAIASIVGTIMLLEPEHRMRIKAIVVNKFHGDPALFKEGVEFIESYTNIPVVGILPYMKDHGIEEEDMDRPTAAVSDDRDVYDEWAKHVKAHLNWPLLKEIMSGRVKG